MQLWELIILIFFELRNPKLRKTLIKIYWLVAKLSIKTLKKQPEQTN